MSKSIKQSTKIKEIQFTDLKEQHVLNQGSKWSVGDHDFVVSFILFIYFWLIK